MLVQVIGSGCPKCKRLAENIEAAANELGIEVTVEKVTNIGKIVDSGVTMTPAVAFEGVVKSEGRVLTREEIKKLLQMAQHPAY